MCLSSASPTCFRVYASVRVHDLGCDLSVCDSMHYCIRCAFVCSLPCLSVFFLMCFCLLPSLLVWFFFFPYVLLFAPFLACLFFPYVLLFAPFLACLVFFPYVLLFAPFLACLFFPYVLLFAPFLACLFFPYLSYISLCFWGWGGRGLLFGVFFSFSFCLHCFTLSELVYGRGVGHGGILIYRF